MKYISNNTKLLLCLLVLFIGSVLLTNLYPSIKITDNKITFIGPNAPKKPIEINNYYLSFPNQKYKDFVWEFKLDLNEESNKNIRLSAHGCIKIVSINGYYYVLDRKPQYNRCNTSNFVDIDLSSYAVSGTNNFKIYITNYAGWLSVEYKPTIFDLSIDKIKILMILIPIIIGWERLVIRPIIKNQNFRRFYTTTFYFASILYLYNLMLVNLLDNTFDLIGHLDYIKYILNNHRIPEAKVCWECYQPPIYYILSVLTYGAGKLINLAEPLYALRAIGFVIYLCIISLTISFICQLRMSKYMSLLAFLLFILWPLGIVKSNDINNDMMVAAAIMFSIYFSVKWYLNPSVKLAACAMLVTAFGMLIKGNAIIGFSIFGLCALLALYERRIRISDLLSFKYIIVALCSLVIGFSHISHRYYIKPEKEDRSFFMYQTERNNDKLWISQDEPKYLLTFPLETYIKYPHPNMSFKESGSNYFWSSFLKTSLYGSNTRNSVTIAKAMNISLLFMISYFIFSSILIISRRSTGIKKSSKAAIVYSSSFILLISMLLSYRILEPASCNQDVRFIYPVIPLFAILYAYIIDKYIQLKSPAFFIIGIVFAAIFIGISLLHILWHFWVETNNWILLILTQ